MLILESIYLCIYIYICRHALSHAPCFKWHVHVRSWDAFPAERNAVNATLAHHSNACHISWETRNIHKLIAEPTNPVQQKSHFMESLTKDSRQPWMFSCRAGIKSVLKAFLSALTTGSPRTQRSSLATDSALDKSWSHQLQGVAKSCH